MNKRIFTLIIGLSIIFAAIWLWPTTENNTTETETPVATTTEATIDPEPIELDLTKLQGKDRLYTEEEGRYENLSEEERKMVQKVSCKRPIHNGAYCIKEKDSKWYSEYRLISLKNTVAVIYYQSEEMKQVGFVYLYDIAADTLVEDWYPENYTLGPNLIVKATAGGGYHSEFSSLNYATSSTLQLYRPGMKDFVEIPNSSLDQNFSYLKWEGDIFRSFPVEFGDDSITVNIYSYDCNESVVSEYSGFPVNCTNVLEGTKTFNLTNLP